MGKTMKEVSLITGIWNRASFLYKGMISIIHLDPAVAEIILVDDDSKDNVEDVVEMIRAKTDIPIHFFKLSNPDPLGRGIANARNFGARKAKYDYLLFNDPENVVPRNSLGRMFELLDLDLGFRSITSSAGWSVGPLVFKQFTEEDYADSGKRILEHRYAVMVTDFSKPHPTAPNADWAISGSWGAKHTRFWLVPKEDFFAVRGYDEEFGKIGGEDWDILDRLGLYGCRTILSNDIHCIHLPHGVPPYDSYMGAPHIEANLRKLNERIARGEHRANLSKEWGLG